MGCSCSLVSQENPGGLLNTKVLFPKPTSIPSNVPRSDKRYLIDSVVPFSYENTHGLLKKYPQKIEIQRLLQINRRKVPILEEIQMSRIIARRKSLNPALFEKTLEMGKRRPLTKRQTI